MDNFELDLLKRFVIAAERIASALEAQAKPAVVAPEVGTGQPGRTVDDFPRPIKEPT